MSERSDYSTSNEDRAHNHTLGFKNSMPNYREMFAEAKAEKKRRKERLRQQRYRASAPPTYEALINKLRKGTANPRGDKLLEQIRGQEGAITLFYMVSSIILAKSGPVSDAVLAAEYESETGTAMTRNQVYRMRQRVRRLREPGRPWCTL